jgi:hypothetical protein
MVFLAPAVSPGAEDDILQSLRPEHPRLYLAAAEWKSLRQRIAVFLTPNADAQAPALEPLERWIEASKTP